MNFNSELVKYPERRALLEGHTHVPVVPVPPEYPVLPE
jgi:hypothetical protein